MPPVDYYSILLLSPADRSAAVEAAYRDYTRMLDHGIGLWPKYKLQRCLDAFSVLLDSARRRAYDVAFRSQPSPAAIEAEPESAVPNASVRIQTADVQPSPE